MNVNEIMIFPVITVICYLLIEGVKMCICKERKMMKILPVLSAMIGAVLGIIVYVFVPEMVMGASFANSILAGIISGLCATGSNQLIKHVIQFTKINSIDIEMCADDTEDVDEYKPFPCDVNDACNRIDCKDCPFNNENEK